MRSVSRKKNKRKKVRKKKSLSDCHRETKQEKKRKQ